MQQASTRRVILVYFSRRLDRLPRIKGWLRTIINRVGVFSVSSHYQALQNKMVETEAARLRSAWQANDLPLRQRKLVEQQLSRYRSGESVDVFYALIAALRSIPHLAQQRTVLEIGCSSGYYSEVLAIAGLPLVYQGCDYSPAFIRLARVHYPQLLFDVADACALAYPDAGFDIVISGCCLLHIPEYAQAIAETARVTKRYAIFHRTPVLPDSPTRHFIKRAYGVETMEIHFNEAEFIGLLHRYGLKLINTVTLNEDVIDGVRSAGRTYVCEKQ